MNKTQTIAIDLSSIMEELMGTFRTTPISPKVVLDIVVRAWELAEVDPVEYYDELRSVVYDELHNHPGLRAYLNSSIPTNEALDQISEQAFHKLHDLLLKVRPLLADALLPFKISNGYEYSITDIDLCHWTLTMRLVRTDAIADYYRSKRDVVQTKTNPGNTNPYTVGTIFSYPTHRR